MRDQRRVLFERRVAVGIAVGVKCKPHFIRWRFLARLRRRRGGGRYAGQLLRRLFRGAKFLPEQRARRDLAGRIGPLQRLQLPLQLP